MQNTLPGLPLDPAPSMKRCPSCTVLQPVTAFARCRSRPDGLNRVCRVCDRKRKLSEWQSDLALNRARSWLRNRTAERRQQDAERRRSPEGRKQNAEAVRRYRDRHAAKIAAHRAVAAALARKESVRPTECAHAHLGECSGRIEMHHPDYRKPLEVIGLCSLHHHELRRLPIHEAPAPLLEHRNAAGPAKGQQAATAGPATGVMFQSTPADPDRSGSPEQQAEEYAR